MNVLPIIVRELRAEARRPVNYWLRTFGAALLTVFFGLLLANQSNLKSGKESFAVLSFVVFIGIWIVVPVLTADCISREKREGTLGLLFLTPLRAIEIILGKGCIHAMRSLTLIIAVLPVMAIPFVLGGITRADVICSLLLDLTALSLALAAGLLASSLARQWSRALILAEIFAAAFAFVFLKLLLFLVMGIRQGNILEDIGSVWQAFFFSAPFSLRLGFSSLLGTTASSIPLNVIALFSTSLLVFLLVIFFAAFRLKKSWQESAPSPRQLWLQKTFCTPRFWLNTFQRRNQGRLSRNPVGWLQQYSWSSRLSKWGWCFVIIAFISWLIGSNFTLLHQGCTVLNYGLLASMAFSAVGSFQREKQNGALELLLVTPLRENQIIWGRLWGIWGQFLPAFFILILSVVAAPNHYYANYIGLNRTDFEIFPAVRDFIIVPVVGLYLALRIKSFLAAWFLTCVLTLIFPAFLLPAIFAWFGIGGPNFNAATEDSIRLLQTLLLVPLAAWMAFKLFERLRNRSFIFVNG